MPVVNPGIRRYIGSAIQRLFNSASFSAPLTHSLTLERGTGSPTFTRATEGTVIDNEGILRTAIAGEARFVGARRVRNLLTAGSENLSSGWVTTGTNIVVGSDGGLPVTSGYAEFTSAVGSPLIRHSANVLTVNNTYLLSFYVLMSDNSEPNTATGGNYRDFSIIRNGADVTNYALITNTYVGNSVWRCSFPFSTNTAVSPTIRKYDGLSTTTALRISGIQLEDITGRTDQTTPSEYVSVGVLSAPYHGAGADGVKCFDTDLSGNPIAASTLKGYLAEPAATNLCLQSNAFTTTWAETGTVAPTQNLTGPDGATSGWTLTDNDAGIPEGIFQTYGTLTAANYAQSIFIKKTSGATSFPVIRLNEPVTPKEALCTVDTNNGIATVWTAYTGSTIVTSSASCVSHNADWWKVTLVFAATTASWRIIFYPAATTNATQATGAVSAAVTGTCGIYGSQLELGSSATSYIPTTTVAVTRNADVLTYTGGDIANIKTLACTFQRAVGVSGVGVIATHGDGTANESAYADLTSATALQFAGYDGGVLQWDTTASNAYTPGATAKLAFSLATNDVKMDFNGTAQTADTSATMPTATQVQVGHVNGSFQLTGNVGGIYGWTRNLSQSELGAIDR